MITKTILPFLLLFSALACNSVEPPDDKSNSIDTTGHNFTFQTWTFGQHSSSVFHDVAIIDENNIWAVGEIYMNDSLGQPDPIAYNAGYWNGNEWTLQKITVKFRGNMITTTLEGVCAFSNTDIWFVGSLPIHGDGTNWIMYDLRSTLDPNISLSKAWGISSNDIYFVGRSGSVAHYSNTNWQKIESGTELNIYDIYGQKKANGEFEIICVAAEVAVSTDKKIFKIINNTAQDLPTAGIPSSLKGIWFKPGEKYYVVGSGMFTKTDIYSSNGWLAIWQGVTESYTGSIDGNDLNDIVVCGSYGEMIHYNGNNWKSFKIELQLQSGTYGEVKIKNNLIIAAGHKSSQAVITIGRRQ
jgi:hypothetical protein